MGDVRGGLKSKRVVWLVVVPLLTAGAWLALEVVSYAAFLRAYAIPSGSMAPALRPGDRIVVEVRPKSAPKRGEVWVFTAPTGATAVKRVVGLPGETVEVAGGRVVVDGRPLTEPYLAGPTPYPLPPLWLGPDEYFLLGDSRGTSFDSHVWGPLDRRRLVGRADYRYWPAARAGVIK